LVTDPVERTLSVVAHEDDDLIFLNPTIMQSIQRGSPTLTAYVTAGEANGNGTTREEYAGQRRDGECAAYATATGVANEWSRAVLTLNGRSVEISTLTAAPHVELVFLGLPDGGDSLQPGAVPNLWDDPTASATTIVYPGSPAQQSLTYTRADLLAALLDLMTHVEPTVVLVQDAEPDPFLFVDHPDHIAAAKFARAALASYATASGNRPILIEHRDYSSGDFPQNLTDVVADDKKAVFDQYAAHDSAAGQLPYLWLRRHFPRWSPGTGWIGGDGQGRLHAFSVQGSTVLNWRQAVAGGAFAGPVDIGGGLVAPSLAVGRNQDGRVEVFGVDLNSHNIVTAFQTSQDGAFSGWVSLGNPSGPGAANTGAPVVGVNADGRLQVFAKNSGGGVSTIFQTSINGPFSAWLDLGGGPDIQNALVCVTRSSGRMALFASTRRGIKMWWQTAPNGGWAGPADLVADAVTSSPTATPNADGRLEVFWRGLGGDVRTVFELAVDGSWSGPPTSLGGPGGVGEVAAVTAADGRIHLLGSNAGGGVSAISQKSPNAGFGAWLDLGGVSPGTPTIVAGSTGDPQAFHITTDGRLLVSGAVTPPEIAVLRVAAAGVDRAVAGLRSVREGVTRASGALGRMIAARLPGDPRP
jgi:LmbE family N-acetylglucosaminyl deacetylase